MNLLVIDFPHGERCDDEEWIDAVNAFEDALRARCEGRDRRRHA